MSYVRTAENQKKNPKFFTARQAGLIFGVPPTTVVYHCRTGQIGFRPEGSRRWYVSHQEMMELTGQTGSAPPDATPGQYARLISNLQNLSTRDLVRVERIVGDLLDARASSSPAGAGN